MPTLSFGIVPQQSATKLVRLWQPLLEKLGARAGVTLRFHTAPDIPEFERRLAQGSYDIAYMNPLLYIVHHKSLGYRAFARQSDKMLRGILVVRKDASITTIADVAGKSVAFPAPTAFAATLLPRAYIRQQGWEIDAHYVSSHDSVYRAVAAGLHPVGGGVARTLASMDPAIRDQLRILWSSREYSPHAFAAHPRVDSAVVDAVQRAMIELADDPDGAADLKALNFGALKAAADRDWNDIRALQLDQLDEVVAGQP